MATPALVFTEQLSFSWMFYVSIQELCEKNIGIVLGEGAQDWPEGKKENGLTCVKLEVSPET